MNSYDKAAEKDARRLQEQQMNEAVGFQPLKAPTRQEEKPAHIEMAHSVARELLNNYSYKEQVEFLQYAKNILISEYRGRLERAHKEAAENEQIIGGFYENFPK